MSLTGAPDGDPGGGPQKVGVAITDIMSGMYAGARSCRAPRTAQSGPGQ